MARAQSRAIRVALACLLVVIALGASAGCGQDEARPVDTPVPIPSAEPTEPIVPVDG